MDEEPMKVNKKYFFKHMTQTIKGIVSKMRYRIDVNTLHREEVNELRLNEVGRISVKLQKSIFYDSYDQNRATGHFIIIDEMSNNTVGCGMIIPRTTDIKELPPQEEPS